MWEVAATTTQKARKEYGCGACEWIDNEGGWVEFDPKDVEKIQRAKADNWMIKKGDKYIKTSGKWEGEFAVFRARLDMDAICQKYGLYPEE